MNCDEVKEKLPEYFRGQCSSYDSDEITKHLSKCQNCMNELSALEKPMLEETNCHEINEASIKKSMDKAKRKLVTKISSSVIAVILSAACIFFLVIPGILNTVRMMNLSKYSRALADIVQFSRPTNVGGYGNSFKGFQLYSTYLSVFTYDEIGTQKKASPSIEAKLNLVTGNMIYKDYSTPQFVHPSILPENNASSELSPDASKRILSKNAEATVAKINVSLSKTISLEDIENLLKDYDVKILWMAVESGEEGYKAKNMTNGLNQYIQWGVPGTVFIREADIHNISLSKDNLKKYSDAIMKEMIWLDKNKKYVKNDNELFKNNGIDNSVASKASYVAKNGLKIYGLQLTGPTKELLKLQDALDIRFESVVDIDFWFWK